jgi:hypothetical protein
MSDTIYDGIKIQIALIALAAVSGMRANDFDPPAPPDNPANAPTSAFMATVYSRTFLGNINRVKEAYLDTHQACSQFVAANLEETKGILDVNLFDSGKCYPLSGETNDPQIATINIRNFLGNYQFNRNISNRYFTSPEACATYIETHLDQMAGVIDISMLDSASCHSTRTGTLTAYAENRLIGGVKLTIPTNTSNKKDTSSATDSADTDEYVGTLYLRNIFGNVSREKIAYLKNEQACTAYVISQLKEAEHVFDINFADSGTCQRKGSKVDNVVKINSQLFGSPHAKRYTIN